MESKGVEARDRDRKRGVMGGEKRRRADSARLIRRAGPQFPRGGEREHLFDPRELLRETQNRRVRGVVHKVGILDRVPGVRERESHRVRRVRLDRRLERLKVARGLAHLLVVQEQVTVRSEPARPLTLVLRPQRDVVVDGKREVILNQILPADSQVERIPKLKLRLHLLQQLLWKIRSRRERDAEEHRVPHLVRHRARLNARPRRPVHVPALQQVRDGVIRHVNRAVRQRLDEKLFVPRHPGPQPERATARPLPEPPERVLERLPRLVVIRAHPRETLLRLLSPPFLAVLEVPLSSSGWS